MVTGSKSRFARLSSFEVRSQDDLYRAIQEINWFEHFNAEDSFAVSFSSKKFNSYHK